MCQQGLEAEAQECALAELGGRECANEDHMVTESAIRGFYQYYRRVMNFD
jgi:salicylate 5-hydroxylase large subunit